MAKRLAQSSVNWSALAERVPAEQRTNLTAFKAKSDKYLRRVLANPPEAPKLNWDLYKQTVPVPGMVEAFKKQYEALSIPYPADNYTSKVDAQWTEVKKAIEAFVAESNANIAKFEKQIAETNALLPYEQMTMEDFRDAHPEMCIDPVNRPTFWPHTEDAQIGYVDKDAPPSAH